MPGQAFCILNNEKRVIKGISISLDDEEQYKLMTISEKLDLKFILKFKDYYKNYIFDLEELNELRKDILNLIKNMLINEPTSDILHIFTMMLGIVNVAIDNGLKINIIAD